MNQNERERKRVLFIIFILLFLNKVIKAIIINDKIMIRSNYEKLKTGALMKLLVQLFIIKLELEEEKNKEQFLCGDFGSEL